MSDHRNTGRQPQANETFVLRNRESRPDWTPEMRFPRDSAGFPGRGVDLVVSAGIMTLVPSENHDGRAADRPGDGQPCGAAVVVVSTDGIGRRDVPLGAGRPGRRRRRARRIGARFFDNPVVRDRRIDLIAGLSCGPPRGAGVGSSGPRSPPVGGGRGGGGIPPTGIRGGRARGAIPAHEPSRCDQSAHPRPIRGEEPTTRAPLGGPGASADFRRV